MTNQIILDFFHTFSLLLLFLCVYFNDSHCGKKERWNYLQQHQNYIRWFAMLTHYLLLSCVSVSTTMWKSLVTAFQIMIFTCVTMSCTHIASLHATIPQLATIVRKILAEMGLYMNRRCIVRIFHSYCCVSEEVRNSALTTPARHLCQFLKVFRPSIRTCRGVYLGYSGNIWIFLIGSLLCEVLLWVHLLYSRM